MDNLFQTLSKLRIETFIRKILNKYLESIPHHGKKIIQQPHHIYIIEHKPKVKSSYVK